MLFLLFFCIYFNFKAGLIIDSSELQKRRKLYAILVVIVNILILGIFKYMGFGITVVNDFAGFLNAGFRLNVIELVLPVGISFYTFHNISYILDVYWKKIKASKYFITYGIYDVYFPLLILGPIERADKLIPQIESERKFNSEEFFNGINLVAWGVFKKVFVADNLSVFVDYALKADTILPAGIVYSIALSFAFQIYADFSGYTDIARGLAKMMGFELSLNFNIPFISSNPSEFWRRWHISLSTWLRDYLYIPMGGNRVSFLNQNFNLLIVWLIGGIWHGAAYGYFIWGIYCGVQIILYNSMFIKTGLRKFTEADRFRLIDSALKFLGIPLTFFLFAFGVILFKVSSPAHLNSLILNMNGFYINTEFSLKLLLFIFPVLIYDLFLYSKNQNWKYFEKMKTPVRSIQFVLLILFSFAFQLLSIFEKKEFFYFQF